MRLLVLGAGYVGAKLAERALDAGHEVVLADNWHATAASSCTGSRIAARGSRAWMCESQDAVRSLLETRYDRVHLLAAQASRPLSITDPGYTEQTNLVGPRVVAEALADLPGTPPPLVYGSSLHVYGRELQRRGGRRRPLRAPGRPRPPLQDLRRAVPRAVRAQARLRPHAPAPRDRVRAEPGGARRGPSRRPWSTSSGGSRRPARSCTLDDGGRATIGVVHVDDVARILLDSPSEPGIVRANVAAETATVGDVARLARGEEPQDEPAWTVASPFEYRPLDARVPVVKLLVTGASGFLGSRVTRMLRERGHEVVAVTRPGPRRRAALDEMRPLEADAGGPEIRELVAGCAAVLHFGGVPDPGAARRDPARAVRENAGTTVNLLEACAEHGAGLVYPSSVRAARRSAAGPLRALEAPRRGGLPAPPRAGHGSPPDLGVRSRPARVGGRHRRDRRLRLARPGGPADRDPGRPDAHARLRVRGRLRRRARGARARRRWDETLTVASGAATPLIEAARLVMAAAGSSAEIETPGGRLAPGENESYSSGTGLRFAPRPLEEAVDLYVDWLRRHHPAQGSA